MACNVLASIVSKMVCNLGEASYEQDGTRKRSVAATSIAGGSLTAAWGGPGRGSAASERHTHDCVGVERATTSRRLGSVEEAATRSAVWARRCAAPRVDAGVEARCASPGLCHGSMDAAPGRAVDRAALWGLLSREGARGQSPL